MSEEMSERSKIRQRWIDAGLILGNDPSARVACPACGEGLLTVEDRPTSSDHYPDRVLRCEKCSESAFLHGSRRS